MTRSEYQTKRARLISIKRSLSITMDTEKSAKGKAMVTPPRLPKAKTFEISKNGEFYGCTRDIEKAEQLKLDGCKVRVVEDKFAGSLLCPPELAKLVS